MEISYDDNDTSGGEILSSRASFSAADSVAIGEYARDSASLK